MDGPARLQTQTGPICSTRGVASLGLGCRRVEGSGSARGLSTGGLCGQAQVAREECLCRQHRPVECCASCRKDAENNVSPKRTPARRTEIRAAFACPTRDTVFVCSQGNSSEAFHRGGQGIDRKARRTLLGGRVAAVLLEQARTWAKVRGATQRFVSRTLGPSERFHAASRYDWRHSRCWTLTCPAGSSSGSSW